MPRQPMAEAVARDPRTAAMPTRSTWNGTFSKLAVKTAQWTGTPQAFLGAVTIIVVWAICGPLFGFSDTWQLVVNTGTTIITFLMVFLIQNTQNRDTMAIQIKLAELILFTHGAKDSLATAEDLSDDELTLLHDELRCRADRARHHLEERRARRQAA